LSATARLRNAYGNYTELERTCNGAEKIYLCIDRYTGHYL